MIDYDMKDRGLAWLTRVYRARGRLGVLGVLPRGETGGHAADGQAHGGAADDDDAELGLVLLDPVLRSLGEGGGLAILGVGSLGVDSVTRSDLPDPSITCQAITRHRLINFRSRS